MQKTIVELLDDIDPDNKKDVRTITFALDGQTYEIDLNEENRTRLKGQLAPFVQNGRRVKGASAKPKSRPSRNDETVRIRDWARSQNIPVNGRGRIPKEIQQAYYLGHAPRT
jgi:hypothetical protein